ncbi:MAG TPA: hypothetical protein VHK22_06615 [Gaiellaceae bacterium]|nr:hypothetical protein [Gaiellaceae bacterium]
MEHEAFYAAAAQVIPLLLVILAVEVRWFIQGHSGPEALRLGRKVVRFPRPGGHGRLIKAVIASYVLVAETFALGQLGLGDQDPPWLRWFILIAIFFELGAVFFVAVNGVTGRENEAARPFAPVVIRPRRASTCPLARPRRYPRVA